MQQGGEVNGVLCPSDQLNSDSGRRGLRPAASEDLPRKRASQHTRSQDGTGHSATCSRSAVRAVALHRVYYCTQKHTQPPPLLLPRRHTTGHGACPPPKRHRQLAVRAAAAKAGALQQPSCALTPHPVPPHSPSTTPVSILLAATDTSQAVAVVKQAVAKANSVPAPAVLSAMLDLEAAKLPVSLQARGHGPTAAHAHTQPNRMRALCVADTGGGLAGRAAGARHALAPGLHVRCCRKRCHA